MAALSIQDHIKTLEEELTCPVLLEPLSNAVTLVPCAHKIQLAAAEQMYGSTNGGWLVQSEEPCSVCRIPVLGYIADHTTRNMARQFFALSESDRQKMLARIKESLSEKSMSVPKDVVEEISYPGKPARFIHSEGAWNLFDPEGGSLRRYITFVSSTKDSLFKEFSLYGYSDHSVRISVHCSKQYKNVEEYFKQFDLFPFFCGSFDEYTSSNQNQLKTIFNIIAENNEIPATHFDQIRDIVAKGSHS